MSDTKNDSVQDGGGVDHELIRTTAREARAQAKGKDQFAVVHGDGTFDYARGLDVAIDLSSQEVNYIVPVGNRSVEERDDVIPEIRYLDFEDPEPLARVLHKFVNVLRDEGAIELMERNELYSLIDESLGAECGAAFNRGEQDE